MESGGGVADQKVGMAPGSGDDTLPGQQRLQLPDLCTKLPTIRRRIEYTSIEREDEDDIEKHVFLSDPTIDSWTVIAVDCLGQLARVKALLAVYDNNRVAFKGGCPTLRRLIAMKSRITAEIRESVNNMMDDPRHIEVTWDLSKAYQTLDAGHATLAKMLDLHNIDYTRESGCVSD
jgi:hypothetical protein